MPTTKAPATEPKKKSLLEEAVGQSGYTRIEVVKIAYMEYLISQQNARAMSDIFGQNLPKKLYSTRKGVKKIQFMAGKTGAIPKSKHLIMFDKLMRAQQRVGLAYDRFEMLAKQLSPIEQASIIGGYDVPVNVFADKPKKQSIVTQINSSPAEKINVKKKEV